MVYPRNNRNCVTIMLECMKINYHPGVRRLNIKQSINLRIAFFTKLSTWDTFKCDKKYFFWLPNTTKCHHISGLLVFYHVNNVRFVNNHTTCYVLCCENNDLMELLCNLVAVLIHIIKFHLWLKNEIINLRPLKFSETRWINGVDGENCDTTNSH